MKHVHLSDDIVGFFYLNMSLGLHETHQQHFTVLFNLPLPFVSAETRHKLYEVQKQPKSMCQWKAFCSLHSIQKRNGGLIEHWSVKADRNLGSSYSHWCDFGHYVHAGCQFLLHYPSTTGQTSSDVPRQKKSSTTENVFLWFILFIYKSRICVKPVHADNTWRGLWPHCHWGRWRRLQNESRRNTLRLPWRTHAIPESSAAGASTRSETLSKDTAAI